MIFTESLFGKNKYYIIKSPAVLCQEKNNEN